MSLVDPGAQWASVRTSAHGSRARSSSDPHPPSIASSPIDASDARPSGSSSGPRRGLRRLWLAGLLLAVLLPAAGALPSARATAATDYLLMPRAELLKLPTSGTAWSELKQVADGSLGSPNLCDINSDHHLRTLAAALVYARTGVSSYGTKARAGVMAGIASLKVGCSQAILSMGRQLTAYVLAADFAGLSGTSDTTFRAWLKTIRTRDVGGHAVWRSLAGTQADSANNWGAYAGASRIAASLYLGDTHDVDVASHITRGFLGNRTAYARFGARLDSHDLSWSCGSASTYTPVDGTCSKSGINVDGAVIADISRGGSLAWPPKDPGINYQLEAIQGLGLQVELLSRHGYADAWSWSNSALRRMAGVVTRSGASGGTGWNETQTGKQMPWLLDLRYGLSIPRSHAPMGRAIGFTDWLYGGGSSASGGGSTPPPAPKPTPKPPSSKPAPKAVFTWFGPAGTSSVPMSGVPTKLTWKLQSSSNGLKRYELQHRDGSGSWKSVSLRSSGATSAWLTLGNTPDSVRIRATDRSGRVGSWYALGPRDFTAFGESSASLRWAGHWANATLSSYLGGRVRWSNTANASASFSFNGKYVAWVAPVGPTRGQARVYLDGTYKGIVNLYASSFSPRRVVYAADVGTGRHKLTIKVVGTAGHPTVAIDALYVEAPG